MKKKIRIVLADDSALMRRSLMALLREYSDFEIVGEASNGRELLDVLKRTFADIVLLDLEMPVMNGIEALKVIQVRFAQVRSIVLSIHNDLANIREAISAGARGYLSKNCVPEQLVESIVATHEKGFYLHKEMQQEVLDDELVPVAYLKKSFSARELEVMKEICNGKTEKEIAQVLKISPHTVHFHKMNIYNKTNAHNVAGLLKFASENEGMLNI